MTAREIVKADEARNAGAASIAALRLLASGYRQGKVKTLGYYSIGDGGGGEFYWSAMPAKSITAVDTSTETFTSAGHGFTNGTGVAFYGTALPGGVTNSTTTYYVHSVTTNTFKIAASYVDVFTSTPVNITSTGTAVTVNYADNNGTIIIPSDNPASGRWVREEEGPLNIEAVGVAISQSAATNRARMTDALSFSSRHFIMSAGTYAFDNSTQLDLWYSSVILEFGPAAALQNNTPTKRSIRFLYGTGTQLLNATIRYATAPSARSDDGGCIQFEECTDCYVENYDIIGSCSAGIMFWHCTRPRVSGASVQQTFADGCNFSNCQDALVSDLVTADTGDDGLSFINYTSTGDHTGGKANNITVRRTDARGIAILGQKDVLVNNFTIEDTNSAGIIAGYDTTYATRVSSNVRFGSGTITRGGGYIPTTYYSHGGVAGTNRHGIFLESTPTLPNSTDATFYLSDIEIFSPGDYGIYAAINTGSIRLRNVHAKTGSGIGGFSFTAPLVDAAQCSSREMQGYGFMFVNCLSIEYRDLVTENVAKGSAATYFNRSYYIEVNSSSVWAGQDHFVTAKDTILRDTQATPTGWVVYTFQPNAPTTSLKGHLGDLQWHFTNLIPSTGDLPIMNNAGLSYGGIDLNQGTQKTRQSTIPTAGRWQQDMRVTNPTPTANSVKEWVCTASGHFSATPPTFSVEYVTAGLAYMMQSGANSLFSAYGVGDPALLAEELANQSNTTDQPTNTNWGTTTARCVLFKLPRTLSVAHMRFYSIAVLASGSGYMFAIYPEAVASSRVWQSGNQATLSQAWNDVTANLPVSLTANTNYWLCMAPVATGATAAVKTLIPPANGAIFGANTTSPLTGRLVGIPVMAQFTITAGTWPSTLPSLAAAAYLTTATSGGVIPAWLEGTAS